MEKEQMELLAEKFKEAYEWRADEKDVDWKDTGKVKLAYLNWAVAWRKMKEIYPDANYRLVETPEGNPLWNVNGFGMVKCAISGLGVEYVETFPIMDNRNEAVKIEMVDARDVNDSMQRGLTKAIARFGIGLYIYEGKLEAPKTANKPYAQSAQPSQAYAKPRTYANAPKPTEKQVGFMNKLLNDKNMTIEEFAKVVGYNPMESAYSAKKAIDALIAIKNKSYEPYMMQEKTQEAETKDDAENVLDEELPF